MGLDVGAVGIETEEYRLRYDWKTLVLYALGIGAKSDELDYLYEGRGPRVYPTFGVVPAYPALTALIGKSGGRLDRLVHGAQRVRAHAPLPPSGELVTRGAVTGVYDLKRLGQLVIAAQTFADGRLIYETEWQMLFLGEGGFGGPRPPKEDSLVRVPTGESAAFEYRERTSPEQALLYRLSGDPNPLHVDPEFARQVGFERGPILHGLATYGFCARALILGGLGGDAARLKTFFAQFRNPVWPGEELRTVAHRVGDRYVLKAYAGGRDEVAAVCGAEVIPAAPSSR